MVLVLSERDVAAVLHMSDAIRLVEDGFRQYAAGDAILMPRLSANLPGSTGALRAMAAMLPRVGMFGVKTLTGYPGRRAEHETYFTLLLFDGADGALRAVMAANHITGVRTGAATGVAAKYLAREDAKTIGLFGAGVQGFHQAAALAEVRDIHLVNVFDPVAERALAFAHRLEAELELEARPVPSPRDAVNGADLVVTATTATAPVFEGDWLEAGTHVSAIGANAPAKCEVDEASFRRSKVVVDFKEQVLSEAGDLRAAIKNGAIAEADVYAELGDIIAGRRPGRVSPTEITMFKSVGVAIEDVAVATHVYKQAVARGLGTAIAFADDQSAAMAATTTDGMPKASTSIER